MPPSAALRSGSGGTGLGSNETLRGSTPAAISRGSKCRPNTRDRLPRVNAIHRCWIAPQLANRNARAQQQRLVDSPGRARPGTPLTPVPRRLLEGEHGEPLGHPRVDRSFDLAVRRLDALVPLDAKQQGVHVTKRRPHARCARHGPASDGRPRARSRRRARSSDAARRAA